MNKKKIETGMHPAADKCDCDLCKSQLSENSLEPGNYSICQQQLSGMNFGIASPDLKSLIKKWNLEKSK